MRYLFYGLLTLVCLAVAGLTFIFVAGPTDLLRDQLVDAVNARTGRDLTVAGSSSLSIYPQPGLILHDVTLSDPPAMGAAPFVRIARLEIEMPFSALMRQQLVVRKVVLHGAVVDLRADAAGRRNWEFAAAPTPAGRRTARPAPIRVASAAGDGALLHLAAGPTDGAASDRAGSGQPVMARIAVEDVRLIDAALRYHDEATGRRDEIKSIDLQALLAPDGGRLTLSGKGSWREEEVRGQGEVGSLAAMLQGQSPLTMKLAARPAQVAFDGTIATVPVLQISGQLQTGAPSIRVAAAWLGGPAPHPSSAESLALAGSLAANAGQIAMTGLTATIGGNSLRGDLALSMLQPRLLLRGALSLDVLDLDADGGASPAGGMPAPVAPPAPPASPHATQTPRSSQPQVRGWSSRLIELGALRLADADLGLDVGRIVFRSVRSGRSRITATVRGGALKAVVQETSLYQGRGKGTLDIDASASVPVMRLSASLEGFDTQALLAATAGFDRIAGRGMLTLDVAGRGPTQQQMTQSLTGTATLGISNGALLGFDMPAMIRHAQRGQVPQATGNPSERTEFSELSGSFAIAAGVAQSQDLKLVSSVLRVGGAGSFDLGRQQMDLRLKPKLVAGAASAGIPAELANLDVPILVRGPWDAPRVSVDVGNVVNDNGQIKKGVEKLGEILKSKEGKEAAREIGKTLRDLLGR